MSNAVWFISFKLKKGVSAEDFLSASEKVHDEVISKQKGHISWKQLVDGETWADLITWETMEDARNALTAGSGNPAAKAFYSLLNMNSCKTQIFSVEKSY